MQSQFLEHIGVQKSQCLIGKGSVVKSYAGSTNMLAESLFVSNNQYFIYCPSDHWIFHLTFFKAFYMGLLTEPLSLKNTIQSRWILSSHSGHFASMLKSLLSYLLLQPTTADTRSHRTAPCIFELTTFRCYLWVYQLLYSLDQGSSKPSLGPMANLYPTHNQPVVPCKLLAHLTK